MEGPRVDPVAGFYGPGTLMWRINREAVLLGAGPAALLLQIAHPAIARAVAEHSTFEADPIRRLHGTLRTTMALVFGDGRAAEGAVRKLNGIHARVKGEGYRALDPELLLWVQATLIVTSVLAYERWVGPLSGPEREQFWQEARDVGVRLGISRSASPPDWPALQAYWDAMLADGGPVGVSGTARRLATLIVRPPLPLVPTPIVDLLALPGLALLPPRLRQQFGIPWGWRRATLATGLDLAIRAWVRVVPAGWRAMPQARAAEHRLRGGRHLTAGNAGGGTRGNLDQPGRDKAGAKRLGASAGYAPMKVLSALTYWAARTTTVLWRPMVGRRWLPMWAMLHTRGRRSGRRYSTPVQVRTHDQWFVIALPWPERSQWIRNVEAAGGCRLTWRGEEHLTDAPEHIGSAEAAPAYNRVERLLIQLNGLDHFLRLRRVPDRSTGGG